MSGPSFRAKLQATVSKVSAGLRKDTSEDVGRLIRLGVSRPRDAVNILLDERQPVSDRVLCCWAIKVAGSSEVVPDLLVAYRGHSTLTWEIATALAVLAGSNIAPLLETLATLDIRPTVRAASAYVLGYLGSRESGEILALAYGRETSGRARQAMIEAIGRLGGRNARAVIEAAFGD